jgi:hypothetical protein
MCFQCAASSSADPAEKDERAIQVSPFCSGVSAVDLSIQAVSLADMALCVCDNIIGALLLINRLMANEKKNASVFLIYMPTWPFLYLSNH